MRISYYFKLAINDIRTRLDIYLPYGCMMSICFFFLYIILYLYAHGDYKSLGIGQSVTPDVILLGSIILLIMVAILCWTFSLTIRRQSSRRQGLYRVLGFTRKNLVILNLWETIFITLASLIFGSLLCLVFGRLLFMIAERFAYQTLVVTITPDPKLIFQLAGYLFLTQLFIILRDTYYIYHHNPLRMLRHEKEQEQPKAKFVTTLLGILSLVIGYGIALSIKEISMDLENIFLAILFVILATYCLFKGTSIMILKQLQKRSSFYYHRKRMITLSNLLFRLRSYATSMASITILLSMLILTASMCISLYSGTKDNVRERFPYYDYHISGLSDKEFTTLLKTYDLSVKDAIHVPVVYGAMQVVQRDQELWIGKVNETIQEGKDLTPTLKAITLSGYNDATKSREVLQKDEVLIINQTPYPIKELHIRMQNKDGSISYMERKVHRSDKLITSFSSEITLVVPDVEATKYSSYLYGNYSEEALEYEDLEIYRNLNINGTMEDQRAFINHVAKLDYVQMEDYYSTLEAAMGLYGSFLFLGILFSILFIFSIFLILYYRMHDDLREHEHQYDILYRIGLTRKELCKEFARENRWLTLTPPILAIIHCIVAFPAFHLLSSSFQLGDNGFSFILLMEGCITVLLVFAGYHYLLQLFVTKKIMNQKF